jgi:hypothetical protein
MPKVLLKSSKFALQQVVHTLVCGVFLVQEIHHYHIVLLAVAVAAANSLLDALGIPG